jgi:hypothetical protein
MDQLKENEPFIENFKWIMKNGKKIEEGQSKPQPQPQQEVKKEL